MDTKGNASTGKLRLSKGERGTPYSVEEAEGVVSDKGHKIDEYHRHLLEFLANRVRLLERELKTIRRRARRPSGRCWATYHGNGGYPDERPRANEVFKVGKRYLVVGGTMGGWSSTIRLKGVEGAWNSALFKVNLDKAPLSRSYVRP